MTEKWTEKKIPSQKGKLAIVTGGSDGVGLETARELARAGAQVIIAADREDKGQKASFDIRNEIPSAQVMYQPLDTSDLDSVRDFAQVLQETLTSVDILVNNAGVTGVENRKLSKQGFEWHFAANYLGHFALTARLLPLLKGSPEARVVHLASLEHKSGKIHFGDLQLEKAYEADKAYAQSKLAMLLFGLEMDRRIRQAGLSIKSIPVHPGGAKTNIFPHGRELSDEPQGIKRRATEALIAVAGQSAHQGALPILFAATSPEAESGTYYGPDGIKEFRGYPAEAEVAPQGQKRATADKLWLVSESLAGLSFDFSHQAPATEFVSARPVQQEAPPAPRP